MKDVITVGLDGTPESLAAAVWAAQEAALRKVRLRLLHAWVMLAQEPAPHAADEPPPSDVEDRNYWPHRIVEDARAAILERHPGLPVDHELVAEDAFKALQDAAAQSDLLVLGSRDLGPVSRYTLGEIGLKVVAHVVTPTVLVRARQNAAATAPEGDVVVGVSLHEPCEAMLDFAFSAAERRGAVLRAVHGRHLPAHAYNRGGGVEPYVVEDMTKDVQRELGEALALWREKYPDVRVDERVELVSPAQALLRDAEAAGLLVVGRRHKRHLLAPRIGHMVQAAVHHAPCPVAVIPHE